MVVPPDAGRDLMEGCRADLERRLESLTAQAEAVAERGRTAAAQDRPPTPR